MITSEQQARFDAIPNKRSPTAKLTEACVIEIYLKCRAGVGTFYEIGKPYGIHSSTIHKLARGGYPRHNAVIALAKEMGLIPPTPKRPTVRAARDRVPSRLFTHYPPTNVLHYALQAPKGKG